MRLVSVPMSAEFLIVVYFFACLMCNLALCLMLESHSLFVAVQGGEGSLTLPSAKKGILGFKVSSSAVRGQSLLLVTCVINQVSSLFFRFFCTSNIKYETIITS